MIRRIAASERFVDEITLVCLVFTLTTLQELGKIRVIQVTKEKTISALFALLGTKSC
jgi:hypothetical protein